MARAAVLAAHALCGGANTLPVPSTLDGAVAGAVRAQLEKKQTAAVAVGVVAGGQLVYVPAFGNARLDSTFAVGSVTKMFTAVSVMQLVSRGKLSLNDPVSKYFPKLASFGPVTVRQLLNHTGGIPNYLDDAVALGKNVTKTTPADILSSVSARALDFAPGTDWSYSNTGYVLLGQIVERVAGLPLGEYEKRNIFDPLEMYHTTIGPDPKNKPVAAFNGNPGDWSWYYADGDVFSNVADLARFDAGLMQGKILPPAFFETMQQTVPFATLTPGLRDGEGVFVIEGTQLRITGHHGGMAGFRADNEMVPAHGLAIVILGNGGYNTTPILRAALRAFFPSYSMERNLGSQLQYDPAPEVTKRATALLAGALAGHIDRTQFQPLASIALPSDQAVAKSLEGFGSLKQVTFSYKLYTSAGPSYVYRAVFSKRTVSLVMVIAKDGKIAAFLLM